MKKAKTGLKKVKSTPTKSKSPKKKRARRENAKKKRGVVYVGHIPHGFYEAQMRDYFSQFGQVLRLRLSRSRNSAKSKGYAFIEFENEEVAKIAVESMNNYLMFERLLKCEYIPPEKVHPNMFKNYGTLMLPFRSVLASKRKYNSLKTMKKVKKIEEKASDRLNKFKNKLIKHGISFDANLVLHKPSSLDNSKINCTQIELEIDSSDDEVTFKTPPNAVKVKLKSKQKLSKKH